MKFADVKLDQAVEVQFIPGGKWYPGTVISITPGSTKGIGVQGTGEWRTECTIAAKWCRPVAAS